MKWYDYFVKYFVGILFIFSGLIKINDPVGFGIKLKEYFEVFANDFSGFFQAFIPFNLSLAVFVVVLEVMLGIALLFNYRIRLISWLFLLLIIFFTFLTFYSAWFNKVTDCGCFGDAITLTPMAVIFQGYYTSDSYYNSFYQAKTISTLKNYQGLYRYHYGCFSIPEFLYSIFHNKSSANY